MAQNVAFLASQALPAGRTTTPSQNVVGTWTDVKVGVDGGALPATTTYTLTLQWSTDGGATWVDGGACSSWGGTHQTKAGPTTWNWFDVGVPTTRPLLARALVDLSAPGTLGVSATLI